MEFVEPIRDKKKIELMKQYLKSKNERDYLMFIIGINTGLRVSDLLTLQVADVKGKQYIKLREKKRNKRRKILLPSQVKADIRKYIKGKQLDEYLFKSREGENKPITRQRAYQILNEVARLPEIKLKEIGTHTLRKTFGYWQYRKYQNIVLLQDIFGHDSPKETLIYIGISQDEKDEAMKDFCL